jgi:hypothetical protein
MKKLFYIVIILFISITFFSCNNAKNLLERAKRYEKQKNYDAAERSYLSLIIKYPKEEIVAEAMYNLGNIYKDIRKDYSQSQIWFSQVITKFPNSEYAKFSKVSILEAPDYLGLLDGNVTVLGDTDSFGKNMLIKTTVQKLDYNLYLVEQNLFAGEKFVRKEKKFYLKTDNEIREFSVDPRTSSSEGKFYTTVLQYPYKKGVSWTTIKDNKKVVYTIVDIGLTIEINKKKFSECIKIMEKFENAIGVKYLYYAPNVGCIRITTASSERSEKEFVSVEAI